ncbi:hypothetical protein LINGRAHAP2_LOCUS31092 [Linum grandiflorum]
MLECISKEEVQRILAVNRWRFDEITLHMDGWIKEDGLLSVLLESDIAWILVRDIPLHLRSMELFHSLGDVCGELLEFEEGSKLSSVRLKVKLQGVVPEIILVCFKDEVYSVKVECEPVPVWECFGGKNSFLKFWKVKGKEVCVRDFPRDSRLILVWKRVRLRRQRGKHTVERKLMSLKRCRPRLCRQYRGMERRIQEW